MRREGLYLRYAAWPEDDRSRWEAAFKAGADLFDDHGAAVHLGPHTAANTICLRKIPLLSRGPSWQPARPRTRRTAQPQDHRGIRQVATKILRRHYGRQLYKPPPNYA